MGFIDAVKHVYTNYVNFQGRASRAEYWWFFLFYVIVAIVTSLVHEVLYYLFVLATILPFLGLAVRRLHDTGHSGWWVLLNLIPLIGFIILIIMSYARASDGPNQYGPPAGQAAAPVAPPEA